MAKNLWIGLVTVLFGCVAGYLYHMVTDVPATRIVVKPVVDIMRHDGEAETSDTIEPLIVENGSCGAAQRMPVGETVPLPRVVLTAGMRQPPRPDQESGEALRMPYADEHDDWLGVTVDRILRIIEKPGLDVFDPTEEAEHRDMTPEPLTLPTPDYHYGHCPYHGVYRR